MHKKGNGPLDLSAPRILGVLGHVTRLIYTFLCVSTLHSRVRETTHIVVMECVGIARDVPDRRRVDLRCLRASCRSPRPSTHMEAVEESRIASA
jgi:hypothetical protein